MIDENHGSVDIFVQLFSQINDDTNEEMECTELRDRSPAPSFILPCCRLTKPITPIEKTRERNERRSLVEGERNGRCRHSKDQKRETTSRFLTTEKDEDQSKEEKEQLSIVRIP